MKLEGNYQFEDATRELVWEMFLDPDVLAKTMPGCERLELVGENEYEGELHIRVGPVQGKFRGTVKLEEMVKPESYVMKIDGRGPAGFVNGAGNVRLEQADDGAIMHYEGDAQVGGRIASVGQRLLDSSARSITKQSLQALDAQVKARLEPPEPENAGESDEMTPEAKAEGPPAPSQSEFALNVARDVANDYLEEDQQRLLLIGLGALGVLLLLRALVRNWTRNLARDVVRMIEKGEV